MGISIARRAYNILWSHILLQPGMWCCVRRGRVWAGFWYLESLSVAFDRIVNALQTPGQQQIGGPGGGIDDVCVNG